MTDDSFIKEVRLDKFAVRNMREYGEYTIEQRALPDYRDGLKPVQRRSLWSAYQQKIRSNGGYKKSARVVGDVIAKYHPHGDSAVYGAIVTMVNTKQQLIEGSGAWGSLNTQAAAYRYTEMKLSPYSDAIMFSEPHMAVSELVNNFDGSEKEPLILPALLPNLLINGGTGMAVGVTFGIPPFTTKSVCKLTSLFLEDKKPSIDKISEILQLNYKYGNNILDASKLKIFFETGESAITILPDYKYDSDKNVITITGGGPYINVAWVIAKLQEFDIVVSAEDHTEDKKGTAHNEGLCISVKLRDTDQARGSVELLMRKLADSITLRFNLTKRLSGGLKVDFFVSNIVDYMKLWCKWRLELESKAQLYIAANLEKQLKHTDLLILAFDNLDALIKEIRKKEDQLSERIAKLLNITNDDADYLRQQRIDRFSGLNKVKLTADRIEFKKKRKTALDIANSPTDEVLATTAKLAGAFNSK
jgi:DNA gyrase subunit A